MPKRPAMRYPSPERYIKVRIVTQPSTEYQELLDQNKLLNEQVHRGREEIIKLNLELDVLMNNEPDIVQSMEQKLRTMRAQWIDSLIREMKLRNQLQQHQKDLKAIEAEQAESRRGHEEQVKNLQEQLQELKLTNTHKAKLTDSECPIVPTFAAFSISDHSESNLDSQSSRDLAPVPELEQNESIPGLNQTSFNPLHNNNSVDIGTDLSIVCMTPDGQSKSPMQLLANAPYPDWFREAFYQLTAVELGESYTGLVQKWIDFETENDWVPNNKSGFGPKSRPAEITTWIKGSRKREPCLTKDSVAGFAKRFWDWWLKLQPTWRCVSTKEHLRPVETFGDDWESLDRPGKNGWLCLLASVKWWGLALTQQSIDKDKELRDDWLKAIRDMTVMLDGLLRYRTKQNNTEIVSH